jgi:hypothetical protein
MESYYLRVTGSTLDDKDSYSIRPLDFVAEVALCEKFKPSSNLMAINYLRAIASEVGRRYDKKFNPYLNIVPCDFVGIRCATNEEIAKVVKDMFDRSYPKIYRSYLETKLRNRPINCKIVYFVNLPDDADKIAEEQGLKVLLSELQHTEPQEDIIDDSFDENLDILANGSEEEIQAVAQLISKSALKTKKVLKKTK